MDIAQITEMITTVGFPIACCCVMFWQNGRLQDTLSKMSSSLELMNERLSKLEGRQNDN